MLTAHYGHIEAGKLMLENGAKIDCRDNVSVVKFGNSYLILVERYI